MVFLAYHKENKSTCVSRFKKVFNGQTAKELEPKWHERGESEHTVGGAELQSKSVLMLLEVGNLGLISLISQLCYIMNHTI